MIDLEDLKLAEGFYYLASPYTQWACGLDDACLTVQRLAARVLSHGVTVFTPIGHAHGIARAGGIDPRLHAFWLPHDRPIAHAAYGLIVAGLAGWRDSFGVGEELKWFAAARKPRYLLDPDTLSVQAMA